MQTMLRGVLHLRAEPQRSALRSLLARLVRQGMLWRCLIGGICRCLVTVPGPMAFALQDAQTCRKRHEPGNAHRPLFHEEQIRSKVSGLATRLLAGGDENDHGWCCCGCGNCSDASAHCESVWSGALHSLHGFLSPARSDITVAACKLALSSFQGCGVDRAACC